MTLRRDIELRRGETFELPVRWEVEPIIYKAITAITKAAPARVTAASHGIPDGWRVAIVSVRGMTDINAENDPPRVSDYKRATVIDANTVDFNGINSSGYRTYTSGGYLQFYTPKDLDGYIARLTIKDRRDGTALLELASADGEIVVSNASKLITITVAATVTEAITWSRGVYDLELEDADGVVTTLMEGNVSVTGEVTV